MSTLMNGIETAVNLMANNKATGEDEITAAMLKAINSDNMSEL